MSRFFMVHCVECVSDVC